MNCYKQNVSFMIFYDSLITFLLFFLLKIVQPKPYNQNIQIMYNLFYVLSWDPVETLSKRQLAHKGIFILSSVNICIIVYHKNKCWPIWTISLLPFWALNMSVALLSMEGQKALEFQEKYLNLCSEDEQRSCGFETTWGWVINDIIYIFLGELSI